MKVSSLVCGGRPAGQGRKPRSGRGSQPAIRKAHAALLQHLGPIRGQTHAILVPIAGQDRQPLGLEAGDRRRALTIAAPAAASTVLFVYEQYPFAVFAQAGKESDARATKRRSLLISTES
jgi:hypothetical protein